MPLRSQQRYRVARTDAQLRSDARSDQDAVPTPMANAEILRRALYDATSGGRGRAIPRDKVKLAQVRRAHADHPAPEAPRSELISACAAMMGPAWRTPGTALIRSTRSPVSAALSAV